MTSSRMPDGCLLSPAEAAAARDQLVRDGYTVVRRVMPQRLLQELREYTDEVCRRVPVSPDLRYQGSSFFVCTPRSRKPGERATFTSHNKVVEKVNDEYCQRKVAEAMGLEQLRPRGRRLGDDIRLIILSKPPHAPPLYWHQDFREWNSPVAATPWPHQIFMSYYLVDTARENGCLRVIPGSHRKKHPLHDLLPNAHEHEIQNATNLDSPLFADAEGAIDVPMAAGDLVIGDARLLHSAWGNNSDERRTLVLAWYNCFHFPRPPSWWEESVPQEIRNFDPSVRFFNTRVPNLPWRQRARGYNAPWGAQYPSIRRRCVASEGAAEEHSACGEWTRCTNEYNTWWYCDADGDWFLEDSPYPWVKYLDPEEKRAYWWKDDQKCFWL